MFRRLEDWLYKRTKEEIAAFNIIITVINIAVILLAVLIQGK